MQKYIGEYIGGSDGMRYFKVISVDGKKIKDDDEGRYKITQKSSPGGAARKAFSQLTKKYNSSKLVFVIKETTQGSKKKEYGPYEGIRVRLKPPKKIMYKGSKKPVFIKHEDRVRLIKEVKQKGGSPQWGGGSKFRLIYYETIQAHYLELYEELIGRHIFAVVHGEFPHDKKSARESFPNAILEITDVNLDLVLFDLFEDNITGDKPISFYKKIFDPNNSDAEETALEFGSKYAEDIKLLKQQNEVLKKGLEIIRLLAWEPSTLLYKTGSCITEEDTNFLETEIRKKYEHEMSALSQSLDLIINIRRFKYTPMPDEEYGPHEDLINLIKSVVQVIVDVEEMTERFSNYNGAFELYNTNKLLGKLRQY